LYLPPAKNAILRVSFAVELRKQGKSIMEATTEAGEQRLRPIIMTSLAFAFGCLPLAIAMGAGANARHSIGTGIIGGMIGETTLAMLYVPLFFYIFDRFAEQRKEGEISPEGQPPAVLATEDPRDSPDHPGGAADMRRFAICMLVASFAGCVAGCMVEPDYVKPVVDTPVAFIKP
jgi:multidrug efflux pump